MLLNVRSLLCKRYKVSIAMSIFTNEQLWLLKIKFRLIDDFVNCFFTFEYKNLIKKNVKYEDLTCIHISRIGSSMESRCLWFGAKLCLVPMLCFSAYCIVCWVIPQRLCNGLMVVKFINVR